MNDAIDKLQTGEAVTGPKAARKGSNEFIKCKSSLSHISTLFQP